jgi:hypothetical protein
MTLNFGGKENVTTSHGAQMNESIYPFPFILALFMPLVLHAKRKI